MGATPKPKREVEPGAWDEVSAIPNCEYCSDNRRLQTHHIKTRGSGGGDTRANLVRLCITCHAMAHTGQIGKETLREIARR
jgi:5-methylcytosine-specific restriction endonuclease McrA